MDPADAVVASEPATTRLDRGILAAVRIAAGLLWLANLEWKRPPDFGRDLGNGLYKYIDSAIRNPVFDPWSWFVEHVVVEQYVLFGWFTLLSEAAVAALLILGFKTRWAAVAGALLTVPIFLSVLYYDKQYEWPWSYYLMAALHLAVFASAAGRFFGLDGVLRRGPASSARAATVLGAVAAVTGAVGLWVARSVDVFGHQGAMVGWADGELKLLWFNPFSAAVTLALGLVALGGVRFGRQLLVLGAAGGFAVLAVLVPVLWRYQQGDWTGGFLGATGPNLAFWGMLALGLLLTGRRIRPRAEPVVTEPTTAA
jgi:thiosulfate dehydrogenase [quinone] large subunit